MIPLEFLHYRTVEKIGEGPSGVVYNAWDTQQHRPVVIKILRDTLEASVVTSIRSTLNNLKHSEHRNICRVFNMGKNERGYFIVSEQIIGQNLQEILNDENSHKIHFIDFAVQFSEGLQYLHKNNIIHGNLKPSNIFLTPEGEVKITDAGLSVIKNFPHRAELEIPLDEHIDFVIKAMLKISDQLGL